MKDLTPSRESLDPIEIASIDEIRALQLERMKWSLKHAYDNVPMYKKRFEENSVHPDDLQTLADLAKFPFTYKDDLRANYPFGLFAVPREQISRIHASSGTTGKPTVVGYTKNDIDMWANVVARSMRRMEKITGSSDDMIILRGVNVFPTQIEELVLSIPELAPYFQIELTRSGRMDAMTVHVEAAPNAAADADRETSVKILTKKIKDVIGISTHVNVGTPGTVERSQGKARRAIDNRPKE